MGKKPTKSSDDIIKLLMVGKTGVGKSATANSIFGRKEFESNRSTSAVTKLCQCAFGERQGHRVKVVDMPGLFDGNLSCEEDVQTVMDKAFDAIAENPDGYNAIVMVTALGRFTQEDKQTIVTLKTIFGEEFLKQYGILVVTHGDLYDPDEYDGKTFEEWCSTENGEFKNLIEECGKRFVLFHNKTKDKNIRAQQLEKLFTEVDELNTMERYTPKIFEAAQADRDRVLLQQKVQGITEKTESKIHKIFDKLQLLQSSESANDVNKIRKLKSKADSLLRELEIEDEGTQALTSVTTKVKKLQEILEEANDAADMNKKLAELSESYRQEKKAVIKRRLKIAAIAIGITVAVGALIVGVVFAAPAIAAALGTTTAVATGAEAAAATAVGATMAGTATAVTGTATAATAVAGTATAATAVAGTATVATAAVAGTATAATAVAGTATAATAAVAGTATAATAVAGTATAATAAVAGTATAATAVADTAIAATAGSIFGLALTVGAVKSTRKKISKKLV